MLQQITANVRGAITLILMTLNVVFWYIPIMVFTLFKIILPVQPIRDVLTRLLTACAEYWIYCNKAIFGLMLNVRWHISGVGNLPRKDWYLVISNHRSWIDILALQQVLTGKIPFLKFFIKQSLIWMPFLGQAWWALDMPFMKRYSRQEIERNPELKGKDLETTRKACQHFSRIPTTVFNFVEGTRFTAAKHSKTQSPYQHLLLPKAGGIAFTMGSMNNILRRLLDVTIVYPERHLSLWDFCCGRVHQVIVDVRERELESWMGSGDYSQDQEYRTRIQEWLRTLWLEKDQRIKELQAQYAPKASH